jgi:hypothetical protein
LRHLYGLPYPADLADWHDGTPLLPHAMVYTTADKYLITSLKIDSCATMDDILRQNWGINDNALSWVSSPDYMSAVRQIYTGTPANDLHGGRDLIICHFVNRLRTLVKKDAFVQLIAETPGLGADILAHLYEDHHFRERPDPDLDWCEPCKDMTPRVCRPCLYQSGKLNSPSDSD